MSRPVSIAKCLRDYLFRAITIPRRTRDRVFAGVERLLAANSCLSGYKAQRRLSDPDRSVVPLQKGSGRESLQGGFLSSRERFSAASRISRGRGWRAL